MTVTKAMLSCVCVCVCVRIHVCYNSTSSETEITNHRKAIEAHVNSRKHLMRENKSKKRGWVNRGIYKNAEYDSVGNENLGWRCGTVSKGVNPHVIDSS